MLVDARELDRKKMAIRHTVADGGEVELLFRGRTYGTVVPQQRLETERAELAQLRARVLDLQKQVEQQGAQA